MAIPFFDIRTHTRTPRVKKSGSKLRVSVRWPAPAGGSASAALAYSTGLALTNCRTGELNDFTRRAEGDEVAAYGIETPRPSPHAESLQALADAIENAEHRKDSRIVRTLIVSIPPELDDRSREALIKDLADAIAKHLDTIAAWALHPPSASGDARNWHGHIIIPTRALSADGMALGAKMERLDNPRTSGDAVAELRNLFADKTNEHLAAAGLDVRIDPGRILEGVPVESASSALIAKARNASAQRKGRSGRGIRAAASITAAVVNGDIRTDDARRFVDQHRARRQWNRSGGRTRYEPRARSRRSRNIVEPAIQRRDPGLAECIHAMMRDDTAPATKRREETVQTEAPERSQQPERQRMSLEDRRAWRAARRPRRRRKREQHAGPPPAGQDVAIATPARQSADDDKNEPTKHDGKTRRPRTHARMSLDERRERREQRPPRRRRRRRSPTGSETGEQSSAGPVAASTTKPNPTPSPSRSRRRHRDQVTTKVETNEAPARAPRKRRRRVRDETPRTAPEPGPAPTPIRIHETDEHIDATDAGERMLEALAGSAQSFRFDPSDPVHKDAYDRAYTHLSGDRMRPDLKQAMWWEISESLQGRGRSQDELRAEWGPAPPEGGEDDRIEVHQSAPLISTRSAGEAAAGVDRIRHHALRELNRIEREERRHDEERLAREDDDEKLRLVRARRKERQAARRRALVYPRHRYWNTTVRVRLAQKTSPTDRLVSFIGTQLNKLLMRIVHGEIGAWIIEQRSEEKRRRGRSTGGRLQ